MSDVHELDFYNMGIWSFVWQEIAVFHERRSNNINLSVNVHV